MKRKFKAIIAAALAAAMCASFAGCGKSDEEKRLESIANELDKELGGGGNANKNNSANGEIESVDPFSSLTVTFAGISPQSKVVVADGNSLCKYTVDKETGVANGDKVTVTAAFKSAQPNKELTETTREYTVEGLASYAAKLSDIPADALNKIKAQSEDIITTKIAGYAMKKTEITGKDSYSFEEDAREFAGYYFLNGKPGFNNRDQNKLYCVYKVRYSVTAYAYEDGREGRERKIDEQYNGLSGVLYDDGAKKYSSA